MGFQPTIPVFKWAKTFHALDSAATVIGSKIIKFQNAKNTLFKIHDWKFVGQQMSLKYTFFFTSQLAAV
jgi:hypothetical protein